MAFLSAPKVLVIEANVLGKSREVEFNRGTVIIPVAGWADVRELLKTVNKAHPTLPLQAITLHGLTVETFYEVMKTLGTGEVTAQNPALMAPSMTDAELSQAVHEARNGRTDRIAEELTQAEPQAPEEDSGQQSIALPAPVHKAAIKAATEAPKMPSKPATPTKPAQLAPIPINTPKKAPSVALVEVVPEDVVVIGKHKLPKAAVEAPTLRGFVEVMLANGYPTAEDISGLATDVVDGVPCLKRAAKVAIVGERVKRIALEILEAPQPKGDQ